MKVQSSGRRAARSVVGQLTIAFTIALALGPTVARAQDGAAPPATSVVAAPETGVSLAELERLLAPLGDASPGARHSAANAIAELGPDATHAIGEKLVELRRQNGNAIQSLLKGMREPQDLVATLLASRGNPAAVHAALVYACLARALAHVGTMPAVRQLVLLSSDVGGALRPAIGKELKQLGDRAIAALIEARRDPSQETRAWAANLLDAMGRRLPSDVVQMKSNQALSDALKAYGAVRDLDAIPGVLLFINSERAQVRVAAREALEAYGQDALFKLRETYAQLTAKPPNEAWTARELSKELFDAYDKFRLQEVYQALDDGLAQAQNGQLDAAIAAFDKVLARQPLIDRRAEMAPHYFAYAKSVEASDRPRALTLMRKALRLDEASPLASEIQAEIAYLDAEELLARGVADADLFRRALALDPTHARARAELTRLETEQGEHQNDLNRWVAAGAVFAVAVAGIILFGGRRKRGETAKARASG